MVDTPGMLTHHFRNAMIYVPCVTCNKFLPCPTHLATYLQVIKTIVHILHLYIVFRIHGVCGEAKETSQFTMQGVDNIRRTMRDIIRCPGSKICI